MTGLDDNERRLLYERRVLLVKSVWRAHASLIKQAPEFGSSCFRLDELLVTKAIDNALKDIQRWEKFHQQEQGGSSPMPDRHKFAGFVARWIAKEKPIQICGAVPRGDASAIARAHWANPILAVMVFQGLMNKAMPMHLVAHLRYWFAFRDERGDTLAFIAYLLEQMD